MPRVSITRIRLRRRRYEVPFLFGAMLAQFQAKRADGCFASVLRRHRGAYWTMTVWRDAAATRAFMLSGAHRAAMPKLVRWCDEASLAHWERDNRHLPRWEEGERRLGQEGRISPVAHPSPAQATEILWVKHPEAIQHY